MDTSRIESLIVANKKDIMKMNSFSERVEYIHNLLDKEFPETSINEATYGPITRLGDFISRTEIEPLLLAIKESARTGSEYITTDDTINDVLQLIYKMINQ